MTTRDDATGSTTPAGGPSITDTVQGAVNAAAQTASQAADTAQQKVSQAADQAAAKANQGMDTAASGLDSLAGTLRDKTRSRDEWGASGAAQQAATVTADKLEAAAQYLRQTDPAQLVTELEGLIRRKPVASALVAVGIGFVVSKLFR